MGDDIDTLIPFLEYTRVGFFKVGECPDELFRNIPLSVKVPLKNSFTRFSGGRLELRLWSAFFPSPRFSNILSLPFLAESFDLISTIMSSLGSEQPELIGPATIDHKMRATLSNMMKKNYKPIKPPSIFIGQILHTFQWFHTNRVYLPGKISQNTTERQSDHSSVSVTLSQVCSLDAYVILIPACPLQLETCLHQGQGRREFDRL